jgi:polyribonucleotide nucleotidyltransferase
LELSGGEREIEIDINDDGRVVITGKSLANIETAVRLISSATEEPELGKIYEGVIDKVMEYGAFVDVSEGISGLIHVSELADGFVKNPNDVVKTGQRVKVKLVKLENGRQSFSIKAATAEQKPVSAPATAEQIAA